MSSDKEFVIYSLPSCMYCDSAKTLLSSKGRTYEEYMIGSDISRDDFVEQFPDVRSAPLIYKDYERVGGYDDLVKLMATEAENG